MAMDDDIDLDDEGDDNGGNVQYDFSDGGSDDNNGGDDAQR